MAAPISFRHRRTGENAIHVGGHGDRSERAVRVVLEAPDGHVLVTSIQQQRDGTFIGEVYGVMPAQRSVAVGDHVQFEESQIVRFRTADERSDDDKSVDDMADMASTFEERFRELSGEPQKVPAVSNETADLFAEAKAWNADEHAEARFRETPAPAPRGSGAIDPPAPSRAVDSVSPPQPPAGQPPVPAARALGAAPPPVTPAPAAPSYTAAPVHPDAAREETEIREAPPVVPARETHTAAPLSAPTAPLLAIQPPPARPPAAAPQSFKCIECGTRLTIPRSAEGATAEPLKIACPACGRINRPPQVRL